MGFLKRISPLTKFSNFAKINTAIKFDMDEPDFLLKRKFNNNSSTGSTNKRTKSHAAGTTLNACLKCGNAEFSLKSGYCKICGTEISSN